MKYFDLHCDTPYRCYTEGISFSDKSLSVFRDGGNNFEKWYQTFAVWIRDDTARPWELYTKIISYFKEQLKEKPYNLFPIFSVEGGAVLENDVERLETLKKDGIKFLTLTWNGENAIAGGIKSYRGLTDFGKCVIKRMNRLNIACDVSHLNEKSFYDAAQFSENLIATHSNCFDICGNPRNLKYEQIKLISQHKGIMGLNFYPDFLGSDPFECLYRNIIYLCEKGFENIIAIGSDFDGGTMDKSLDSISKIPELYRYLHNRGLEIDLLERIFYKNAEKFIAKL